MENKQQNPERPAIPPEQVSDDAELTAEVIVQHLQNGATLGDVVGITLEQREAIYTMGHYQYVQGKYVDAMKFFRFLLFHDQFDVRAIFGVGCCLQMQKHYEEAQVYLGLAVMMEPSNPASGVQFAECLLMAGKKPEAINILQKTRQEFGKFPKYELLIRRVDALLKLASASLTTDSTNGSK
jgi:type III secretion system low calcium response chaperone LcrH/SycD